MKSSFTLLFILLSFFSYTQSDTSKHFIKFSNENYLIEYPTSWAIDTSKDMGTEVVFFSPVESISDKFKENINLIIQSLPDPNIDLDKYAEVSKVQISNLANDPVIYDSKKIITKNNSEYYKLVFGMTQGIFKLKFEQHYFIRNGKAYVLTFTAELDKFDLFIKEGEQVLNSFSLQ